MLNILIVFKLFVFKWIYKNLKTKKCSYLYTIV